MFNIIFSSNMTSFSVKITELDFDGEATLKIEFSDSTNKYFCEVLLFLF